MKGSGSITAYFPDRQSLGYRKKYQNNSELCDKRQYNETYVLGQKETRKNVPWSQNGESAHYFAVMQQATIFWANNGRTSYE